MDIIEKSCKQCGRMLPVDKFRKYAARGRGVYNTKQGYNTICKDCESISGRAASAMKKGDQASVDKLREHYTGLMNRGLPPVTAAAKRLMGIEVDVVVPQRGASLDDLLASVAGPSELMEHCRLVRERGYGSFSEADAVHRMLSDALREAGLYEEINDLMDEWYMDE